MISLPKLLECLSQCHFLLTPKTILGTQERRELISLEHWSWALLLFIFLRKHSSSSEEKSVFVKKITDLSNVLWLAHGRAWIETQVCLIPKLTVFFFYTMLNGLILTWLLTSKIFRTSKTLGFAESHDFLTVTIWVQEFLKGTSEAARRGEWGRNRRRGKKRKK